MQTHNRLVKKLMRRPGVREEVNASNARSLRYSMRCSKPGKPRDSRRLRSLNAWAPKLQPSLGLSAR